MMRRKIPALAVCVSLALQGCSSFEVARTTSEREAGTAKKSMEETSAKASKTDAVIVRNTPKITAETVVVKDDMILPEFFAKPFAWHTSNAQTLPEVLDSLSSVIKVGMRATEILKEDAGNNGASTSGNSSSPLEAANFITKPVTLNYQGTLKGLLDEIAARYDVSWRYLRENNSVVFFRYETRAISLPLPQGKKKITASINLNGGGSSGGGGGGSGGGGASVSGNVSVDQNQTVDPWVSVMQGIRSILGTKKENSANSSATASTGNDSSIIVDGTNGYAVANPELGIVTVTARPEYMNRVNTYLESVSKRFARNILIDVTVYSVTLDDSAAAGVSANLMLDLFKSHSGTNRLSIVSAQQVTPTGTPGQIIFERANSNGTLSSAQVVIDTLSQLGKVSLRTQGQVIALNGQPAPFQNAQEISYVSQVQTSLVANAGAQTTTATDTRVVGFTANFLPMVYDDNRILLQYQIQISNLLKMDQIPSGDGYVQLPQIATQSLQQQAFVKDGQSIMLFGFDQNRAQDNSGTGLLSWSRAASNSRTMTVILIQVSTGGAYV